MEHLESFINLGQDHISKIIKKLADVTYRIQNCSGRRRQLVVHFDRLKPCHQDMWMEESFQNKTTSAIYKLKDVACEQSTLPTVHDFEDDFMKKP